MTQNKDLPFMMSVHIAIVVDNIDHAFEVYDLIKEKINDNGHFRFSASCTKMLEPCCKDPKSGET